MGRRSYNRLRYAMENEAQLATIKTNYTKFRVEGYPAGYVNQPARGGQVPVSLNPFCLSGTTTKYITRMSSRAKARMSGLGLTEAEANIDSGASGTFPAGQKAPTKFRPARAVIFVPKGDTAYAADSGTTQSGKVVTEDTDATPVSAVTGIKYNRRLGNSYTIPFGSSTTAGQVRQTEMQGFIYVRAAKGSRSVSFQIENPA